VGGSCEHSNEPSGSVKGREFLDQLSEKENYNYVYRKQFANKEHYEKESKFKKHRYEVCSGTVLTPSQR
jgi:hypothetical protein